MNHQFDVDVAVKYGVNAAILFQNICFWCQKNKANNKHYHDGTYWTYNSHAAFVKIFPYLSEHQIKKALEKLIDDGVLMTGNYGDDKWKRPTWYAVTKKGWTMVQKCLDDGTKMSDRSCENVPSYTDINTIDNPVDNPDICPRFSDFWKIYPNKVKRKDSFTAWRAGKCEKIADTIIADVKRRLDSEWKGDGARFVPHPTTYIHGRRWEDEPSNTTPQPSPSPEPLPAFMTHEPHKEYSPDERKAMYREMGFKVD